MAGDGIGNHKLAMPTWYQWRVPLLLSVIVNFYNGLIQEKYRIADI